MTTFQKSFGIKKSEIKDICILLPLLRKDILRWLGIKRFSKGKLYDSGNTNLFTVIHTGVGPALLGDAVLYLGQTPCHNIILFGSCGLVKEENDLRIGSLVAPSKCYSLEGFTEMLLKDKKEWKAFYGDRTLLENFLKTNDGHDIKKVTCVTIGSLKLEEGYVDIFKERQIQVADMECSAFFSASKYIGRNAMALFYITDIINKKPFYRGLNSIDKLALSSSIKSSVHILCQFIEKSLNC